MVMELALIMLGNFVWVFQRSVVVMMDLFWQVCAFLTRNLVVLVPDTDDEIFSNVIIPRSWLLMARIGLLLKLILIEV